MCCIKLLPFLHIKSIKLLHERQLLWMLIALFLQSSMLEVEADCYWCLSKLLEGIQDHYTYAQPGIQRTVFRIKELIRSENSSLSWHLSPLATVAPAVVDELSYNHHH